MNMNTMKKMMVAALACVALCGTTLADSRCHTVTKAQVSAQRTLVKAKANVMKAQATLAKNAAKAKLEMEKQRARLEMERRRAEALRLANARHNHDRRHHAQCKVTNNCNCCRVSYAKVCSHR